jgi:hypothetical protein
LPALLISGTHDRERHRIAPGAPRATRRQRARDRPERRHELLPDPQVQELVLAFLDGRPERKPIVQPPPEVRTIEDARRPPARRR